MGLMEILTQAFLAAHHAIAWWGPGAIGLSSILLPWILFWPFRHHKDHEDAVWMSTGIGMGAIVLFYGVWFLLPYPGLELLAGLFTVPVFFMGLFYWLFDVVVSLYDWIRDWRKDRRAAKTKPFSPLSDEPRKEPSLGIVDGGKHKRS